MTVTRQAMTICALASAAAMFFPPMPATGDAAGVRNAAPSPRIVRAAPSDGAHFAGRGDPTPHGEPSNGVDPRECPQGSLFSQTPHDESDFLAGTSEAAPGLRRYEDYSGAAGEIEGLVWWGLDLDYLGGNQWQECAEPNTVFDVSFHLDAAGAPGPAVCSYRLTAVRIPTGISYLGAELNQYFVQLPAPCVLVNGWVSLVGRGDPECWFLWMSSSYFGESYCQGCGAPLEGVDLSVCLLGAFGGLFGACCDDATGVCMDEKVEITDCVGLTQRFLENATCDDFDPPCGDVMGACCMSDATCARTTEDECATLGGAWLGANTECFQCPCITPCPPGGAAEGEPTCQEGYVDNFNGGCNTGASGFSPIADGQTVCGTGGVFQLGPNVVPDFDWYELVATRAGELTWFVDSEFPAQAWILDGTKGCPGEILTTDTGGECAPVVLSANVPPGTYWLVLAANQFSDSAACGARYYATATLSGGCLGDLDGDNDVDLTDLSLLLSAFGASGAGLAGDLDGDLDVDLTDLSLMLAAFGQPCA